MTERQKMFCYEMSKGASPEEAARKAGFTKKGMENTLLQKVEIQAYIAQLKTIGKDEDIAANQEILYFLTSTMRGEDTEDIRLRMKAAELLGKSARLFHQGQENGQKEESTAVFIVDDIV